MNEQGRATVLAWQGAVDAAWQRQSDLLASPSETTAAPAGVPPPGASPQENAAYWRSLSEEERRRLVREQPELVGGRDGFPADQRDIANRVLLGREKAALQAEHDRLLKEFHNHHAETPPDDTRLVEVSDELDGIAVIESRLNQQPKPDNIDGTKYYLLGFNTNGPDKDATAIIAHGNPDTAANVATYVPGAESSFAQMGRLLNESDAMYGSANRLGTNSSVITWLGYDAPPTVVNAVSPAYAIDANQPLDRFQQGLRAVNPDSHNTVVGHSYGSVVVGYAARDGGLPVDDIIALGSPGMGVATAAELNIPSDRVWVLEANRDPIADTQAHGYDPGDDRFGAHPLSADPEGRRPTDPGDISLSSHLNYFYDTPSSYPSYYNIGDVIAGRPPSHP